jgi:TPR repeat protein
VPLDSTKAQRLYQLAARSGSAHVPTSALIAISHGMAPAVSLEHTRDAVYRLNIAARLGNSAAAEHLASLVGRRDVTSSC